MEVSVTTGGDTFVLTPRLYRSQTGEKGERMYTQKRGLILLALSCIGALAIAYQALATASSKKGFAPPEFISQESLKGSMQGSSGIAADLNGDGNQDLVIGAPYAQSKGAQGCLLVYLTSSKELQNRSPILLAGEGNLGGSLVVLGDLDGDGKRYFAAGAVNGTGADASLCGTVTIYKGGSTPRKAAVLEGENALDRFGFALASGDLDGNGSPDLIVSAPMHSPTASLYQQGAVYVYFGPDYDPSERIKIVPSAPGQIGLSLASGDINEDGVDDLLIGASGKMMAYYGKPSFRDQTPSTDFIFTSKEAGFGSTVAVLFDLDNDGSSELGVGANQATVGGVTRSGRLFILRGNGTGTINADVPSSSRFAVIDGEPNSGQFGSAILATKSTRGEDYVLVSAVHENSVKQKSSVKTAGTFPLPMTGKIYLIGKSDLNAGTPAGSLPVLPGTARDMHFGSFLALAEGRWGKWLAAGAPTENKNAGRVRLFDINALGQ
jgi:hypothetical protein